MQSLRPEFRHNWWALATVAWWTAFAAVSCYWASGGMWLLDTAVQEEGVELARARPAWIVWLTAAAALVKLVLAAFGYLLATPLADRVPRWCLLAFGTGAGLISAGYGLLRTLPAIPHAVAGGLTTYGWAQVLLWMPQFWVGGLLIGAASVTYARRSPSGRRNGATMSST